MNKKCNPLILSVPDPFAGSAQTRLIRMGVLDGNKRLNHEVMTVFAGVFAGLFFDDLCDYYDDVKDLLTIYRTFEELYNKRDFQRMYLCISIQYDYIHKSLPDPIWWLAGDNDAVYEYMTIFMERYAFFMTEAGFNRQERGDDTL